jgi:hypothetical protein
MGLLASIEVANIVMPRRQISLIYRKNRKHMRAVQAFFSLLADLYAVAVPDAAGLVAV